MTTAPARPEALRPFRALLSTLTRAATPAPEQHLHYDRAARVWRAHDAADGARAVSVAAATHPFCTAEA